MRFFVVVGAAWLLAAPPDPPPGVRKPPAGKPDIEQYGSEADAKNYAERVLASRMRRRRGMPEMVQFSLGFWTDRGIKRSGNGSHEAKLDREKGLWTVIGVWEIGGPAPQPAWETDWKFVLRYTAKTGAWHVVSSEWIGIDTAMNGERLLEWNGINPAFTGEQLPRRPCWDGFFNPARYGWRPVGEKDNKGGGP